MGLRLLQPVPTAQLAAALGLRLIGPSRAIETLCGLDALVETGLSFMLRGRAPAPGARGTVFGPESFGTSELAVLATENARLDFIRAQHLLDRSPGFAADRTPPEIHPSARVGANTVIEPGVSVGEGTRIGSCVVIKSGTRIGRFCEIKSGAVIGEQGFGFERDENQRPLRMIHLGGVRIGDHVEIGALTTVVRGALGDTVLEDYVKLDDHVHVAHNCFVGEGTIITACTELSGSVRIGRNAWIGPNASIMQKVTLADDCLIGLGAVVLHSVDPGVIVCGNPAHELRRKPLQ